MLLTSPHRWALMHELRSAAEPSLADHLARLSPCDLVLVEGFKHEALPKLEVHRAANAKPLLFLTTPYYCIASDIPITRRCPLFNLDDPAAIADFILDMLV